MYVRLYEFALKEYYLMEYIIYVELYSMEYLPKGRNVWKIFNVCLILDVLKKCDNKSIKFIASSSRFRKVLLLYDNVSL